MKKITMAFALVALTACSEPVSENATESKELGIAEVTGLLGENTSNFAGRLTLGESSDEEHYFEMTGEQFEALKHDLPAALKEVAQSQYGYDLFSDRGTVLNPRLSTFTFKMGVGTQFHYIVHGVRADLSETRPNTVVTIVKTKQGEQ